MFNLNTKMQSRERPSAVQAMRTTSCAITAGLLAVACSSIPVGSAPTVEVLPGGGKDMVAFNQDDIACRSTARDRASENSPLPTAMGLGNRPEVIASSRGRISIRESSESTTGSVFGGSPAADAGPLTTQQRFDTAYVQCMYSRGHKIPMKEQLSS
jgi:hypothetical protein